MEEFLRLDIQLGENAHTARQEALPCGCPDSLRCSGSKAHYLPGWLWLWNVQESSCFVKDFVNFFHRISVDKDRMLYYNKKCYGIITE